MRNVDPVLLSKLNNQHQTKANDAQPKMSVAVARARNTVMDSTYWTVETIRTGDNLGDVSIAARRQKVTGPPNRIYEIHVVNGVVGTAIREYPDKLKAGWQNQFTLGAGTNVAIAFDGEWQRYRNLWRFVADDKPWIFWVDDSGVLWRQLWDDESTKDSLSTGVSKVKAIRGWKNTAIHYLDQGIVAAYIKTDGTVWYRNYCIQEDHTTVWEYEKQLTEFTGTAQNINLFTTNDYRMGFVIEDSLGQIHWLITPRNWGGMASPAENIETSLKDITFEVIPIEFYDTFDNENIEASLADIWFNVAEPIYPEVLSVSNEDEYTIIVKFSHEVDYDLSTVKDAFEVRDSMGAIFAIVSTSEGIDSSELVLTLVNFASASGSMFVKYDRNIIELDCLNQGSRFAIESFDIEFMPDLAPPEGFLEETIEAGITNLIFDVKQVYYIDGFTGVEQIEASVNISFDVTKVGENPL